MLFSRCLSLLSASLSTVPHSAYPVSACNRARNVESPMKGYLGYIAQPLLRAGNKGKSALRFVITLRTSGEAYGQKCIFFVYLGKRNHHEQTLSFDDMCPRTCFLSRKNHHHRQLGHGSRPAYPCRNGGVFCPGLEVERGRSLPK